MRTLKCRLMSSRRRSALAGRRSPLLAAVALRRRLRRRPQARRAAKEDVNRRNADGSTPLQWAVYDGDVAEVKRLLRAGADVSLANNYGATPMSLAAEVGNTEMLKVLLEAGADVDSPNADGMTALLAVARTGNVEAAQAAARRTAPRSMRTRSSAGRRALMWASARRHPEMMRAADRQGRRRQRALHRSRLSASRHGRGASEEPRQRRLHAAALCRARELHGVRGRAAQEQGADIDLPDPDGVSPLLVAIMNANWDLAKQLIEAGADVNQWDIFGEAPLFTAVDLRTRIDGGRASIDPPNETTGLAIVKLLLERGANPNMQLFFRPANVRGATNTRGSTPLIRAADNGDLEVVKLLLEHGADATVYMADRQTPIHAVLAGRAPETQALELIRVLHKAGTDVNVVALINHHRGGARRHGAALRRAQALQGRDQAARLATAST